MRAVLFVIVSWIGLFAAAGVAAQPGCQYPYRVGYRVETVGTMRVAIWYPTLATPAPFAYTPSMAGYVAYAAAPSCARLPLVVFSHGHGGCGTQSLYFTEELARHGYVVAAPDHDDAVFCTVDGGTGDPANLIPIEPFAAPAQWSDATYVDRRDDLLEIIDTLLADPVFGPIVDAASIGAAGHSLGGYPVLGLAGAWPTWKDSRVKAVLAFSPYISPYTFYQTLEALDVPVMYQGAQLDILVTPTLEGPTGAFAQTPPPKYYAKLKGGTHFAWTNAACGSAPTVRECLGLLDPSLVDAYGIAFLDRHLKGERTLLLNGSGAGLAEYRYVR